MTHGYFTDRNGNKSSTRLIGFIVIMYALLMSTSILIIGFFEESKVMVTAAASGTLFTAIAGPAMFYLFKNKTEELK